MGMCSFWLATIAPHHITRLEVVFKILSHSFLPPDRVFAQIEKLVKAKESLVSPSEYSEIYEKHGTVIWLGSSECPVMNFKAEAGIHFKPSGKWHF